MRSAGVKGIPLSKKAAREAEKRRREDADPESPGGQDGDAALNSDDDEPYSNGVESMVQSLQSKAAKRKSGGKRVKFNPRHR